MRKITILLLLLTAYFGYAQPTTNPAAPTNDATDVISVYGDTYTNVATNYDPNWGQSGFGQVNTEYDPGTGEFLLAYPNFNYQGTELTAQNASAMEFLHVDIWTSADPGATDIQVSPINNGTGPGEVLVSIAYTSGTWTSVDIPKSAFAGMTWDNVFQMKFAANGPGSTVPVDIYLDNIYFWKNAADPTTDATLSDLQVDGATIPGFGPATTEYTYSVLAGSTDIPVITSAVPTQSGANASITQATSLPGEATVEVTASDNTTTLTYTISYVVEGPSVGAPTPPVRPADDVEAIFCNRYPNSQVSVDTYDTPWCPATTTEILIDGNPTMKVTGLGCEGVEFITGRFDATSFTNFHIDIYTDSPTQDASFNVKFSNWNGGGGEANAIEYSFTNASTPALPSTNPGTWISFDVPLDNFTAVTNADRNDLVQFVITSNLGTVYYDNLYLHKGTLSTDEFSLTDFSVYPNPTQNVWNVKTNNINIDTIQVLDIQGRQVLDLTPNGSEAIIDASNLPAGLYFARINTPSGTNSIKLIKQ
jgi:hypothetical protein